MQRKLVRYLAGFAAGFVALFVGRLLVGFTSPAAAAQLDNALGFDSGNRGFFDNSRKNYFSGKGEYQYAPNAPEKPRAKGSDPKYEKVAKLGATTTDFAPHEKALRASIKSHNAVVQDEESSGLVGHRFLHVSIGVPPANFDAMLDEVRSIGTLTSIQVNKTDKTNEYKDLEAHRISLDKAREALILLKSRNIGVNLAGHIDEQINLENKILETEENIQKLGVRLGEFDGENEFVTIQCALTEAAPKPTLSIAYRAKVAFEWTVKWYLALLGIALLATLCSLVLLVFVDKLRRMMEPPRAHELS